MLYLYILGQQLILLQYYMCTKDPLPMDVDFLVQDTYSVTRPQWKLVTDLEEATKIFGEAVAQNYKTQDTERAAEPEEDDADSSSSDEGLEEDVIPEAEEDQESSDEAEADVSFSNSYIYRVLVLTGVTQPRHPDQTTNKTKTAISKRKSSSPAKKRNAIPKSKPSSTASSKR